MAEAAGLFWERTILPHFFKNLKTFADKSRYNKQTDRKRFPDNGNYE